MYMKWFVRTFVFLALIGTMVLAACQPAATPTVPSEPEATSPPETTEEVAETEEIPPTTAPEPDTETGFKEVPRNRTLIWAGTGVDGKWVDYDIWNPYAIGTRAGEGSHVIYEPLAYYSAFADEEYMWLAESYEYNDDYTELTIKTRSGINWSDGEPFSAEDVAYTLEALKEQGASVQWGTEVQQFVDKATATDENTVVITFKMPAPRFWYFMTYKFDIGVYIVPKHIFEGQDWTSFKNFDVEKGWPVSTGPFKVVFGSPEQKVFDRRDEWWAVDAGLVERLPAMERLIAIPHQGESQVAQLMLTDELDHVRVLIDTAISLVEQDESITTHSGRESPYGYIDWWPLSLFVNTSVPPYDDPEIRWALSYYIDRDQTVEVAFSGYGSPSSLPMPPYLPLQPYFDSVSDLLAGEYNTNEYNPQKGDAILTEKGWTKDGEGFWVDPDGNRLAMDILGFDFIGNVAPVVAEQLRQHGVDATFSMPPDVFDRFTKGEYVAATFGHGGSVRDPYATLNLYQCSSQAIPGWGQVNFSQWCNDDYDAVVDQVFMTPMDDIDRLQELYRDAMEVWLPELPDIQLTQYYHNIVMDTTYWTGWPSDDNNYVNEHSAALTWPLVLMRVEPTQ